MHEVFQLRGSAAFSASRLARLTEQARSAAPSLTAEHSYFAELSGPLAADELARLKQ